MFALVPVAVAAYAIYGTPCVRAIAIEALRSDYHRGPTLGSYYPWRDLIATLAAFVFAYGVAWWLGAKTASVLSASRIYRYRVALGLGLALISAILFLCGLYFASISTYTFGDCYQPEYVVHPFATLAAAMIVLLFNGVTIVDLARDTT